jgi:hypothetical protein
MKQTLFFLWAILIALFVGCNKSDSPTDSGNGNTPPANVLTSVTFTKVTSASWVEYGDTTVVAASNYYWVSWKITGLNQKGEVLTSAVTKLLPSDTSAVVVQGTGLYAKQLPWGTWSKSITVRGQVTFNGVTLTSQPALLVIKRCQYDPQKNGTIIFSPGGPSPVTFEQYGDIGTIVYSGAPLSGKFTSSNFDFKYTTTGADHRLTGNWTDSLHAAGTFEKKFTSNTVSGTFQLTKNQ